MSGQTISGSRDKTPARVLALESKSRFVPEALSFVGNEELGSPAQTEPRPGSTRRVLLLKC